MPAGFAESLEILGDTLGSYAVISQEPSLQKNLTITHYDLTKYTQDDLHRLNDENSVEPPRKGFFISGRGLPPDLKGRAFDSEGLQAW